MSRRRSPISSPPGCCGWRRNSGRFCGSSRPRFRFDAERFDRFLGLLPRDSTAAAALAEHHDHRLTGRAWTKTERRRRLRHAVEIRHPSFLDPTFVRLLRRHNVALVFADAVDWPYAEDVTADFLYLRLRRCAEEEPTGYPPEALDEWAERARGWAAEGRDVFLYFINGAKVRAPAAAQALIQRLT